MTVRELVVKLLLDSRGVSAGAAGAQRSLDQVGTSATRAGNEIKGAADKGADGFERLAGVAKRALAVIGGIAFLKSTAAQYFANADAVGKFSDSIGENIEDMQAWSEAAVRAGGSAQGFQSSVAALTANLSQAATTGTGRMLPFLKELGIKATDAGGKARKAFEILPELAEKFEGLSKAESMGLGQKLGLDSGTIMLLQSGRRAVDDLIKRQKELGVYTKEDAEIAGKANDAFADMGQALRGVAAVFMRVAGPALTWLSEKLTGIAVWVRKNEPFVLAFFTGLAAIITMVATPAVKAFALSVWGALAPFLPLIAIVALLAIAVDDLIRYIRGGKSAFSDLWKQFGTGEEIAEKLRKAWEVLQAAGKKLFSFLISAVRTAFQVFGNLIDLVYSLYKFFEALINLDFNAMSRWGGEMLDAVMRNVAAVGELAAEFLDMLGLWEPLKAGFTTAADAVLGAWETVKQWFQEFFGWVLDTWNSVKDIPGSIADSVGDAFDSASGAVSSGIDSVKDFFGFGPETKGEAGNVTKSQTITRTTHIGQVTVQTQATDAKGIAGDMGSALSNQVNQSDGAFG